jgi:large subunit ribosomal protein L25
MSTNLTTETRTETGKGIARKLRATGKVPAVLYNAGGSATALSVNPLELSEIFRQTGDRNTVVQLEIDGKTVPALVKDAQRHPVSRDILHVDFLRLEADRPIEVMVKVRHSGRAAGAAMGGRVRLMRRALRTRCTYDKIPALYDIDVSPMEIGDMVKASDIATPDGVEVVIVNDFNVLTLYGKRAAPTASEES